jgi:Transposase DDE domain group 1
MTAATPRRFGLDGKPARRAPVPSATVSARSYRTISRDIPPSWYEDVNDADRLCRDPAMRQLVGGRAVKHGAASASAIGRFETAMLTRPENLAALADMAGRWIDAVHDRRPPKSITLDLDSSESPVHGEQESAAWNGHFQSRCLHPFVRVHPVRRSGAVRSSPRQRPQRRRPGENVNGKSRMKQEDSKAASEGRRRTSGLRRSRSRKRTDN